MPALIIPSCFWLVILFIFFMFVFGLWVAKTNLKKSLILRHQEKYYLYALMFLALLLFCIVLAAISINNTFFTLNDKVLFLFKENFNEKYKHFFEMITVFGKNKVILATTTLTSLWFIYKKDWRTCFFWFANVIIGMILIATIKDLVAFPRPFASDAADVDSVYSFPSGHVTRVTLLISFFAALISNFLTQRQKIISFFIAASIITLMSISRLFFEAHWFSDVTASIGLGLFCALTTFSLYQRKTTAVIAIKPLLFIFSSSWILSWAYFHLPTHLV